MGNDQIIDPSGEDVVLLNDIHNRIYTIRGVQVMLDADLALLYKVETRVLNQAVKRNIKRFPESFCFQLSKDELDVLISHVVMTNDASNLKSQFVTSSWGGRRTMPYVFTEQGVAMLSAILRSEVAVEMSVKIIDAFVNMRRFILSNAQIFQRLDALEITQFEMKKDVERIFSAIESKEIQPLQGIFYDGQIFDAYIFISDLFKSAKRSITIIDNYLDESILTLLTKRRKDVRVLILTKYVTDALVLDVDTYNKQYPTVELREFKNSHDRFVIIDDSTIYHFGASLKDLGKKWFAFSRMENGVAEMLGKLKEITK